jgi:hypothetical protein
MKGIILLFLVIAPSMILWGYTDKVTRARVKQVVRKNLFAIVTAAVIVTVAVVLSLNTTLKLV